MNQDNRNLFASSDDNPILSTRDAMVAAFITDDAEPVDQQLRARLLDSSTTESERQSIVWLISRLPVPRLMPDLLEMVQQDVTSLPIPAQHRAGAGGAAC